jgi:tetratricopeptide (TPR) repeat protein
MNALLTKLLAYHQAFWSYDRWYKRAWVLGPPAAAASTLALCMIPGDGPPHAAPWVKPVPASTQQSPDLKLCIDSGAENAKRGDACDRLIRQGDLPNNELADAYFGRGWARANAKQFEGAVADYTEAIRLWPKHGPALNNRGAYHMDRGDLEAAMRDFEEAIKSGVGSNAMPLTNKAEVLRRQGKLSEAQTEVNKALAIDANLPSARAVQDRIHADIQQREKGKPGPDLETGALRKRANTHLNNKDYDSAIADMTEVIRKEGATSEDFHQRGIAYLRKGENALALGDFDRAVSRTGHGPEAHFNLALVNERMGNLDKAREDLDAAVNQHNASDPDYFIGLGRVYTKLNNFRQAIVTYDKLVDRYNRDSTANPTQKAIAFYLRGHAKLNQTVADRTRCPTLNPPDPSCMDAGRFMPAMLDLDQALMYAPSYADANFEKGWILGEAGNAEAAIAAYTAAIKASPNFSMAYNNRGLEYVKLKQLELAFADYNDAIRQDPSNKQAWANRGVLLANNRQRQRAIDDLRKALSIDRNYAYALQQLQKLGARP